jgi:hypothetical protein
LVHDGRLLIGQLQERGLKEWIEMLPVGSAHEA